MRLNKPPLVLLQNQAGELSRSIGARVNVNAIGANILLVYRRMAVNGDFSEMKFKSVLQSII
jgi:hypothetical protein